MVTREIVIGAYSKTEARPAAMLVQVASRYDSSIYIEQSDKRVNAKSIMGVMTLEFLKGERVTAIADGTDEAAAMDEIEKFLIG